MSEVEKMYENAGLSSHFCKYPRFCDDNNCNECPNYSSEFTSEKQLELIKWLAVKGDFESSIDIAKNTYDYWTIYFQGARWTAEGFEESLAGLINSLWQDLTEQERTEIRSILNG